MADDRRHRATCDWNLYPEYRDQPDPHGDDLCNLDCLAHPDEVAKAWALLDGDGCA